MNDANLDWNHRSSIVRGWMACLPASVADSRPRANVASSRTDLYRTNLVVLVDIDPDDRRDFLSVSVLLRVGLVQVVVEQVASQVQLLPEDSV